MRVLILFLCLAVAQPVFAEAPNWAAVRLQNAMNDYQTGNYRAASRGFKRIADHGSAIAETMLGVMHAEGKGVRPHAAVAAGYFYRAASRGYGPAQIALSDAFAHGRGVRKSAKDSYFWARVAATNGNPDSAAAAKTRLQIQRTKLSQTEIISVAERLHDWRALAVRSR